jgi:hypothetical protein
VHHADADKVAADLIVDFRRLGIPLFDDFGNLVREPA